MGRPFEATRTLALEELRPDYVLTEGEVVAAIAHHIEKRHEEIRDDRLRDRIRKRLTYVPKKKGRQITCISPGKYTAAETLRWARQHFAIEFGDIPVNATFVGAHSGGTDCLRVPSVFLLILNPATEQSWKPIEKSRPWKMR